MRRYAKKKRLPGTCIRRGKSGEIGLLQPFCVFPQRYGCAGFCQQLLFVAGTKEYSENGSVLGRSGKKPDDGFLLLIISRGTEGRTEHGNRAAASSCCRSIGRRWLYVTGGYDIREVGKRKTRAHRRWIL